MARTPLYDQHVAMGAKIVDFAGWEMPIQYTALIQEHHQVRKDAGMFDVSHMTVVDLTGTRVREFLSYLLANNVGKLQDAGKALYTCMLNEQGGVIDDLIVYFQTEDWFRLVVNAGTRDKDIAWINEQAEAYGVAVNERAELAMVAVQGPNARAKAENLLPEASRTAAMALKPFNAVHDVASDWFIARTGYTGEDGFEIILPEAEASDFWQSLHANGVEPIGLGARDTLRLEAGMNLYGSDMNEETLPFAAGLSWTLSFDEGRDFIGRAALETAKANGVKEKLVGLVLEGRGVLRGHQKVIVEGVGEGEITSGTFSPTMGQAIALARVPAGTDDTVAVEIRGKQHPAKVVKPPFVRNGQVLIK